MEVPVDALESEEIDKKVEVKKEAQKKRKHTKKKLNLIELSCRVSDKVVESVTKAQKESDELFIDLERKRMKLEEQMLIMEDRRWKEDKEREGRQRIEEQEFQMRMMMIQHVPASAPAPPLYASSSPYRFNGGSSSTGSSQQLSESDLHLT